MHDYRRFALMMTPIEEKDLILFEISAEEKNHVVKQFNRALLNTQKDGTDVSQIILKALISRFPEWGDCALLFGICLASEKKYKRALSALEYAVNNTLGSEQYLTAAQECMKCVKEDMSEAPSEPETRGKGNWTSVVAESRGTSERVGMQAPILVKASAKPEKMGMASDRERRDIMMRGASSGDEMAGDDIDIENVRTPADNLRLTVRIITVLIVIAVIGCAVWFGIIPLVSRIKRSSDTEQRLDYLIDQLEQNREDPEVAQILSNYGNAFSEGETAAQTEETNES